MQIDNTSEFRSRSDAETSAELNRQIREASPGITDADLAAKAAALQARVIGWSVPQAEGEVSELKVCRPGEGKAESIASALADMKPEPPALKPPQGLTPQGLTTEAYLAARRAQIRGDADLAPPADRPPGQWSAAEHRAWRQYCRTTGRDPYNFNNR